MVYVALPTRDIVRHFKDFERLFSFYEEGIKGLVRDTVLLSSAWVLGRNISIQPYSPHPVVADGLLEKVMRDYASSSEAMMQRLSENTSAEAYVELVTEMIDRAVGEMMYTLFVSSVYDVSKTEYSWVGDDLVIKMRIYERPRDIHRPFHL